MVALVLWSAQDLAAGKPFPGEYRTLLIETLVLGLGFSALLAGVIVGARRLGRIWSILIVGVAAVGIAMLHGWIDAHLIDRMRVAMGMAPLPIPALFLPGLMSFVLLYGLYATALGLMFSAMAVRDSERRLAEAHSAAQQAQLAALRFQLNPHFLFNTLNAISSLIVTGRNAEAEQMTTRLCAFLRTSLEVDPHAEVTLDEELATTQSYLEIEAARFGERLCVEFDCPPDLLDVCVPSFLLQPLVENSVKYAVARSRHPVRLLLTAGQGEGVLHLSVRDECDAGAGGRVVGGTGLGLANVRKRLEAFYGEEARIEAGPVERGFAVDLTLPLRRASLREAAE